MPTEHDVHCYYITIVIEIQHFLKAEKLRIISTIRSKKCFLEIRLCKADIFNYQQSYKQYLKQEKLFLEKLQGVA